MGKILIVDSSLLDRKRMRIILEAAGHGILEMSSPEQVMEELPKLTAGSVKLVLTELHFPSGSGLELIRWFKQRPHLKAVPVLVVTQQPARETLIELVTAGAYTVVTKPFGGDVLLRRVTESLAELVVLRQGEGDNVSWRVDDYLRRELKRAERTGSNFSIVVCRLLDLLEGQALPHLMGGLSHLMRESDILARMGDDQVVVLLPDTDWAGAAVVEARVRAMVKELQVGEDGRLRVPLKVETGAATYPAEAANGDSLLALAISRLALGGRSFA